MVIKNTVSSRDVYDGASCTAKGGYGWPGFSLHREPRGFPKMFESGAETHEQPEDLGWRIALALAYTNLILAVGTRKACWRSSRSC
jgi:hypothetical protein